jgi:hypothetical protein
MNEIQIRERVHEAVGQADYPSGLASSAAARLKGPAPEKLPRAVGLVAAIIALAVIAALVGPRLLGSHQTAPAGPRATAPSPSTDIFGYIPPGDFDAAGLSSATALVTPFHLDATNTQGRLSLIGAYADPARTVLLLRTTPDFRIPIGITVSDEQGFINASSATGGGLTGEYFYSLDAGPRTGSDGLAHLTVTVPGFPPNPPQGTSTFALALKVEPSTTLAIVPSQFDLGAWKVNIETAEVTPSVVHIQAVITGASVDEIATSTLTLADPFGQKVNPSVYSASVTVPKEQLNSTTGKITRVNEQWLRPAAAGVYRLQFAGGGETHTIDVMIPAPDPNAELPLKGKGLAPKPADFPVSPESLQLQGFITANLTSGHPTTCGVGGGSSGTSFYFGLYFQVDSTWYSLGIYTDPAIRQYTGPGTYTALARLYGPTQKLYEGKVQLTVTSDRRPDNGSVRGTLDPVGSFSQLHQSVSGTWTCTPDPLLGPA